MPYQFSCVEKVTRVMKLGSAKEWDKIERNVNVRVCVARCYRRYDAPLADINQISVLSLLFLLLVVVV